MGTMPSSDSSSHSMPFEYLIETRLFRFSGALNFFAAPRIFPLTPRSPSCRRQLSRSSSTTFVSTLDSLARPRLTWKPLRYSATLPPRSPRPFLPASGSSQQMPSGGCCLHAERHWPLAPRPPGPGTSGDSLVSNPIPFPAPSPLERACPRPPCLCSDASFHFPRLPSRCLVRNSKEERATP